MEPAPTRATSLTKPQPCNNNPWPIHPHSFTHASTRCLRMPSASTPFAPSDSSCRNTSGQHLSTAGPSSPRQNQTPPRRTLDRVDTPRRTRLRQDTHRCRVGPLPGRIRQGRQNRPRRTHSRRDQGHHDPRARPVSSASVLPWAMPEYESTQAKADVAQRSYSVPLLKLRTRPAQRPAVRRPHGAMSLLHGSTQETRG